MQGSQLITSWGWHHYSPSILAIWCDHLKFEQPCISEKYKHRTFMGVAKLHICNNIIFGWRKWRVMLLVFHLLYSNIYVTHISPTLKLQAILSKGFIKGSVFAYKIKANNKTNVQLVQNWWQKGWCWELVVIKLILGVVASYFHVGV